MKIQECPPLPESLVIDGREVSSFPFFDYIAVLTLSMLPQVVWGNDACG
jgi:hypothetical protein